MSRYIKKGIKDPRFANPYRYILSQIQGTQYDIIPYKGAMGDSTAQPINESNMADIEDALVAIDTDLAFVEADYINAAEHALKQDKTDNALTTSNKTVVGAINELKTNKQEKTDSNLDTTDKTVVGSINELVMEKQDKTDSGLTTTDKTVVGSINELVTEKQDKTDNALHTSNKTVVGAINYIYDDYINGQEHGLKQDKTDNGLATENKTVVGSINEVKDESEVRDAGLSDAIAIVNNKVNALPMNGSLKNIQSTSVGIPTSFTVIDLYNTKQEVANYQPNSLDYKGSSQPGNIVMKTIGDYIFDFSVEASHTNSSDTTITIEAYIDGVKYDTATRVLNGGNNQINGFTGFFSFSKGDDATPSEIYFQFKASQANTTSAKAMINTNLQGNSATQSFTDTDHVTGISMTNAAYNGQTSSFIINDLDATRLKKSGGTMTGALNMGGQKISGIQDLWMDGGYFNIGTFNESTYGTGMAQMYYNGINEEGMLTVQAKDAANGPVITSIAVTGDMIARGHKVWTAGNDGSGSGLDADKLDGIEATGFIKQPTAIGAGADMNTFTTPGMYSSANNSNNCVNVPLASLAFSLLVEKHAGVKQTWTAYGVDSPRTFVRNYYQSWGEWHELSEYPHLDFLTDDFSATDFGSNLKETILAVQSDGFRGNTFKINTYGEAHATYGNLHKSFKAYMDTQSTKWDMSWYSASGQLSFEFSVANGSSISGGSEFEVKVVDMNTVREYNFRCEADDPVVIKAALTTNEKGNTQDRIADISCISLDELGLDGQWVQGDVPGNIKKAYDKVVSIIGADQAFTIVQGLYNNVDALHYEFTKSIADDILSDYGGEGIGTSVFEFSITFGGNNGTSGTTPSSNNTNFMKVQSFQSEFTKLFKYDAWDDYRWMDGAGNTGVPLHFEAGYDTDSLLTFPTKADFVNGDYMIVEAIGIGYFELSKVNTTNMTTLFNRNISQFGPKNVVNNSPTAPMNFLYGWAYETSGATTLTTQQSHAITKITYTDSRMYASSQQTGLRVPTSTATGSECNNQDYANVWNTAQFRNAASAFTTCTVTLYDKYGKIKPIIFSTTSPTNLDIHIENPNIEPEVNNPDRIK